jgi:hypothetical protein
VSLTDRVLHTQLEDDLITFDALLEEAWGPSVSEPVKREGFLSMPVKFITQGFHVGKSGDSDFSIEIWLVKQGSSLRRS